MSSTIIFLTPIDSVTCIPYLGWTAISRLESAILSVPHTFARSSLSASRPYTTSSHAPDALIKLNYFL